MQIDSTTTAIIITLVLIAVGLFFRPKKVVGWHPTSRKTAGNSSDKESRKKILTKKQFWWASGAILSVLAVILLISWLIGDKSAMDIATESLSATKAEVLAEIAKTGGYPTFESKKKVEEGVETVARIVQLEREFEEMERDAGLRPPKPATISPANVVFGDPRVRWTLTIGSEIGKPRARGRAGQSYTYPRFYRSGGTAGLASVYVADARGAYETHTLSVTHATTDTFSGTFEGAVNAFGEFELVCRPNMLTCNGWWLRYSEGFSRTLLLQGTIPSPS